jgi:tetratricopeptide (TPR) repeat protein
MLILKRMRVKFLTLFSLMFCCAIPLQAQPLPQNLEPLCKEGFGSLYQMDYATAKRQFEQMIKSDSKHPAGYVYLASAIWLEHLATLRRAHTRLYNRGNAFFRQKNDAVDPVVDRLFHQTMQKGIVRAQLRLRADKNDLAGLYYLGTAYGSIAGYESTVKRAFLSSLRNGTEAVEMHKKVIKSHPQFVDAYLSLGMYNYVVGTLPAGVKVLMMLGGVRGSKQEGLKQLEKVVKHGNLARDEAAVILVVLYDREGRYQDAQKLLAGLVEKYPRNPIFRFESAAMYSKLARFAESVTAFETLLKDPVAMDYMPDLIHFESAEAFFVSRAWQKAYEHYLLSRRVLPTTPIGIVTLSHLRAGQCLDALGKKEDASIEYRFVLNQPDIQGTRNLAKSYLKTPFRP